MRGFGSQGLHTTLELLVNKGGQGSPYGPVDFREGATWSAPTVWIGVPTTPWATPGSTTVWSRAQSSSAGRRSWPARAAKETDRYVCGYGVATALHGNGVAPFAPDITVAELMVHEDGSVLLRTGLTDHGAGTYTLMKQIVAETLDIPFDQDRTDPLGYPQLPYDMGSGQPNTWSGSAGGGDGLPARWSRPSALWPPTPWAPGGAGPAQPAYWTEGSDTRLTRADLACYAYDHQKRKAAGDGLPTAPTTIAGSCTAHLPRCGWISRPARSRSPTIWPCAMWAPPSIPCCWRGPDRGAVLMGMGMALFEGLQLDGEGPPSTPI